MGKKGFPQVGLCFFCCFLDVIHVIHMVIHTQLGKLPLGKMRVLPIFAWLTYNPCKFYRKLTFLSTYDGQACG